MGKRFILHKVCVITVRGLSNAASERDCWAEVFCLENDNKSL